MTDDGKWAALVEQIMRDRDEVVRSNSFMFWSLLAQDNDHTVFGKPVTVTFSWPDGLPLNLRSEQELRNLAREQIAKLSGET